MCNCSCDGDFPSILEETFPKARKKHICCECGSDIDPGEIYQKIKGLWEDEWLTFKTCMICYNIRHEANRQEECSIPFECLFETVGSKYEYAAL